MDTSVIPGFIFMTAVIASVVIMIYTYKADKKDDEKRLEEDRKWLEEELAKSRWAVEFELISGEVKRALSREPYNNLEGHRWNIRYTSKRRAYYLLETFYKEGYFEDSDGVTYPACNIKQAKLIEMKGVENENI